MNTKKKIQELEQEIKYLKEELEQFDRVNCFLTEDNFNLEENILELQNTREAELEELERLRKIGNPEADETTVTVKIHENALGGTPIVRYDEAIVEKLIETGYLNDSNSGTFAVQLALVTLANEILHQLVESFTEEAT